MKELGGMAKEAIRDWWHVILTIAGAAGIAFIPLQLQRNPAPVGGELFWWIVLLVASCIAAALPQIIEKLLVKRRESALVSKAETAYKNARGDLAVTVTETIPPNLELLAKELLHSSNGAGNPEKLISNVLGHCRAFLSTGQQRSTGGEQVHVRANYYRLVGRGRTIRLVKSDGTGGNSRQEFTQSSTDGEGCAVVKSILERRPMFCPDVTDPAQITKFSLDASRPRQYKAFLSVPVASPDRVYGMLSVNSLTMGVLDEDDEKILLLMAWLIIIAEILRKEQTVTQGQT